MPPRTFQIVSTQVGSVARDDAFLEGIDLIGVATDMAELKGAVDAYRTAFNERLGKPRLGPDNRSLDVLVSRLRRKAEDGTQLLFPLRAARGAGYVFAGEGRIEGAARDNTALDAR